MQKQQVQFLEKQRNYYQQKKKENSKKIQKSSVSRRI